MTTLQAINNEYNQLVNNLNNYYNNQYNRIRRMRIHPYYKNLYFKRLLNYYRFYLNKYKNIRQLKLNAYYQSLSAQNVNKSFKALMVGINYKNTQSELRGCINDVNSLKNYFNRAKNLNENDICTLTDDTTLKPTRENILQKYKELLVNSEKGDVLYFTYSGHGSYTLDKSGDELDGKDELLVSIDHKGISDDELKKLATTYLKDGVTLFVLLDCCHSGTLLDLKYNYLSKNDFNEVIINERNQETKGNIYFISGCRDEQTSADAYINRKFQGAMTWSFLESLKTNNKLSWKELLLKMRTLLKNHFTQVPQFSSGLAIDINAKTIF